MGIEITNMANNDDLVKRGRTVARSRDTADNSCPHTQDGVYEIV